MVSTPELVAQGQQIFAGPGRCRVCHGDGGSGGRFGPDLTDDEWVWIDPSSPTVMEDLVARIREGVSEPRISDSGMPPMGGANLTDEQLQALAAYILSL
jgi:mono/diheme cytochrome c family protein